MTLRIDYSYMISGADGAERRGVQGGISPDEWAAGGGRFAEAHAAVERWRSGGLLGFLDLPGNDALHRQSTDYAASAVARGCSDVVVLGIGGSALGPIALRTALRPSGWNFLDDRARGGKPRLHVLDNVDPATMAALLERLDLARTLFLVISKSGGTAETMAQYLIARGRLEHDLGKSARDHIVFVTDPERGVLRRIAHDEGIATLDIPLNVGGRFSVLSPVGILPAALIGIDTRALLDGAGEMAKRCAATELARNPAGVFATLQWLADTRNGQGIQVMMPYSDALRDFAAWWVQLWAESLGKRKGEDGVGPTPIPALGATDQHSQVQLFMEGPTNKTVTFLAVREESPLEIPPLHGEYPELAYLGGHRLGELLDIERRATAGALAQRGRPSMTITMDRVDASHLGALIMLLEIATVYAGALYGVNPLDQPGVELGKQFTYAMLGRQDAEAARREWNLLPKGDPRWVV